MITKFVVKTIDNQFALPQALYIEKNLEKMPHGLFLCIIHGAGRYLPIIKKNKNLSKTTDFTVYCAHDSFDWPV